MAGPSGSGKTTLLNLIGGLDSPSGGRIMLDGKDITPLAMHQRARIGLGYFLAQLGMELGLPLAEALRSLSIIPVEPMNLRKA